LIIQQAEYKASKYCSAESHFTSQMISEQEPCYRRENRAMPL